MMLYRQELPWKRRSIGVQKVADRRSGAFQLSSSIAYSCHSDRCHSDCLLLLLLLLLLLFRTVSVRHYLISHDNSENNHNAAKRTRTSLACITHTNRICILRVVIRGAEPEGWRSWPSENM